MVKYFVLDKGLLDGITKDMIAITHRGLAGKISGVSDSYSSPASSYRYKFFSSSKASGKQNRGHNLGYRLQKMPVEIYSL